MEDLKILLTNAGLVVKDINDQYVYIEDPACIFTAFDTFLNYAWIVIVVLTAIMLFGWGVLYIKNGVKLSSLSNNVKSLVLIFGILGVMKPIMNVIYHQDNLFGKLCETKAVSMDEVQKLLDLQNVDVNSVCTSCNENYWPSYQNMPGAYLQPPEAETNPIYIPTPGETAQPEPIMHPITGEEPDVIPISHQIPFGEYGLTGHQNTNGTPTRNNNLASNLSGYGFGQNTNGFSNPKVTVFINQYGQQMRHIGGSRGWRNNNPGNIKSNGRLLYGANGIKDGFLVFSDPETGLNAIPKVFKGKNYNSLSLFQAMHKYAPASDNNVPTRYANNISKMTGISVNKKINDMSDQDLRKIALAIKKIEGWEQGKEEKM